MKYNEVLKIASEHLYSLKGQIMPILDVYKPTDIEYGKHLSKIISKLSPLIGNMIEYNVCTELNKLDWNNKGVWERQDPGFPDTIFRGAEITPSPGIEIKTWFPLATEITARFKDSIRFFDKDQTNVALVAWLPEFIIYGKPKIIDIWIGSAQSLAQARDAHYCKPPGYLVFEPEDTSSRTANLQQTNNNGYKFQGNQKELEQAEKIVKAWGESNYSSDSEYQDLLKMLMSKYNYRLDTNFAKIDRIQHPGLEEFKANVLNTIVLNHTIKEWSKIIASNDADISKYIESIIK